MDSYILIIDDDITVSTMMRRGLTYEGYEVVVAADGRAGLLKALERQPDLIILDVMMPGIDGLEVCRRLRKETEVPVLMVTARDSIADRVVGLETGADDYLVKPFDFQELAARVKALLRRSNKTTVKDQLTFEDLTLHLGTRVAKRGNRTIELSTTEYNLLHFFLQHPMQVLTRDVIMERVWGYDFQGESNVLEVYVGYLRQKTEKLNEPRLIHTVRGAGYAIRL
ncbi:MAG: response regulator transcription factor [Paenibacillaceae bacterium]